jgi:hypothetical protein
MKRPSEIITDAVVASAASSLPDFPAEKMPDLARYIRAVALLALRDLEEQEWATNNGEGTRQREHKAVAKCLDKISNLAKQLGEELTEVTPAGGHSRAMFYLRGVIAGDGDFETGLNSDYERWTAAGNVPGNMGRDLLRLSDLAASGVEVNETKSKAPGAPRAVAKFEVAYYLAHYFEDATNTAATVGNNSMGTTNKTRMAGQYMRFCHPVYVAIFGSDSGMENACRQAIADRRAGRGVNLLKDVRENPERWHQLTVR